jgi:hypothetical protein
MNGQYVPFYTLEQAEQRVYEFLKLLDDVGIKDKEYALYRACLKILEFNEWHKKPELSKSSIDSRAELRAVLGLNDFIAKILSAREHRQFNILIPHLRLLPVSLIPQTVPSTVLDHGSNKLFEFYIAILCMHSFSDVSIDPPDRSRGNNPDVILISLIRNGLLLVRFCIRKI